MSAELEVTTRLLAGARGITAPEPPPLSAELDALLKRMRLPYFRRAAPEVCATARAQRWDPAEVMRVLLAEEVKGMLPSGQDAAEAFYRVVDAALGQPHGVAHTAHSPATGRCKKEAPTPTAWSPPGRLSVHRDFCCPWTGNAGVRPPEERRGH